MPGLIEDYALISDRNTAGLVGRDGSIDWLCFPRFDSEACFAALLGDEENGHWRLSPVDAGPCDRRGYVGDSLILETEWDTPQGSVRVTDFMPERDEVPNIVRIVEGLSGKVEVRSELRLRFGYGRVIPWVRRVGNRLSAVAGPDSVWVEGGVRHVGRGFSSCADFTVEAGEKVSYVMTWQPSYRPKEEPVDPQHALEETCRFWAEWAKQCTYDGPYRDAVLRSLITLKGLTYAPTGGIVAAVTTSLPEIVGGVRNWDYRYSWLRDSTFTLQALVRTGYTDEAVAWREWLLRAIAGVPKALQILYGIAGERWVPEAEIPWLPGYEGSRPVRVGNGAVKQHQLDVYGEVMDTLWMAHYYGLDADHYAWQIQRALVDWLAQVWREPDEGIWEVRGPRRHFTHSKVLAWVAADRAVRIMEGSDLAGPIDRYRALRDEIHRDVCEKGYDPQRNTFTQYYGSTELDAALLQIPQVGFLPPDDERVRGTLRAVQRELSVDGFIRRYQTSDDGDVDGLPGSEGAFFACSFWLADALVLDGQVEAGRELFERLLELRNDVGLLAEEYDPTTRRQVGNVPQAYSHVALVNTALNLLQAPTKSGDPAPAEQRAGDET